MTSYNAVNERMKRQNFGYLAETQDHSEPSSMQWWGVPGAILSVPMLAITKIVCDRVQSLAAFRHFLEG